MLGELLGGVLAPPAGVESSGIPSPPVVCGHLRAAISIASYNGVGAHVVAPIAYPTAFFVQQPGDGRQVHEPLPGTDTGGYRPPTCSPGWLAAGVPPDQVGARAQGPAAGTVAPSPFGVAAAWRALLTHDGAHRVRARLNASAGPGGVDPSVPAGWRGSC